MSCPHGVIEGYCSQCETPAQRIAQETIFSAQQVQDTLDALKGCEECTRLALMSAVCGVPPLLVCIHQQGFLVDQLTDRSIDISRDLMKTARN